MGAPKLEVTGGNERSSNSAWTVAETASRNSKPPTAPEAGFLLGIAESIPSKTAVAARYAVKVSQSRCSLRAIAIRRNGKNVRRPSESTGAHAHHRDGRG